jgi:steroid 5-alpha reductase family enzyme
MIWLAAGLAIFLSLAMAGACRLALATGQSGKIDSIWTFATGAASICAALAPLGDGLLARRVLVAGMALIWTLRLGIYMWRRASRGPEDPRYAALKREWGDSAGSKLFMFLQAQAMASWPLVLGAFVAAHTTRGMLGLQDAAGIVLFLGAIVGESVADRQMADFRHDPANRGKICDTGLWAWSRHPNYFFEWLGWFAYPILAISGENPWGWLALGAPLLMYVLLVHVSGIPPLEAQMAASRGDAFRDLQRRVNAFFPSPPRPRAPSSRPSDLGSQS